VCSSDLEARELLRSAALEELSKPQQAGVPVSHALFDLQLHRYATHRYA
jgi:hypothetical protein